MKKILTASAITAAVIFTGCWDSGNGGMSTPDFAKKMAFIGDVNDSIKILDMYNDVRDWGELGYIIDTAVKNKKAHIADKMFLVKKANTSFKPMRPRRVCENKKIIETYECEKGGNIKISIETKNDKTSDKICLYKISVQADKCKKPEIIYDWFNDIEYRINLFMNGSYIKTGKYRTDKDEELEVNQIFNFVEKHDFLNDKNETTREEVYNNNYEMLTSVGYNVDNEGNISESGKALFKIYGQSKYDVYKENNLTYSVFSKADFTDSIEYNDTNEKVVLNGWFIQTGKVLQKDGNYSSKTSGFAYKNLVIESEFNNTSNIVSLNVKGKLGRACLNGMVNIDTNKTIEVNETLEHSNKIPMINGQVIITGANNSQSTINFYKDDENNTHAIVKVKEDGNKTLDNWSQIKDISGDCNIYFDQNETLMQQ